ncbi:sugar MFS transporter [Pararcticibacter amylolyticus]|uniref:MFS transporter n=1 Tax=Pararcticibacter amylolyticus TaxID=2173175 RepID=A0A2U2PAA4_9SPHI|nr:sugar MFS transporter [Pararcticibacter amylolyticus]PWG78234.1 MFS transporter [Pararcticibacter amylolyticus]
MKKDGSGSVPLYALTLLFFMWGFITCMNDVLIPHLKELFQLTYLQAMLVQFCFFGAYFTGSLIYFLISHFHGDPINKIGYKNGILLGLVISGIGCCLFYPAASMSLYGLFLGAFFILGLGFTLLQITANPYVSLLGPEETASSRLNLVQAFNSFGTTIAPIIGGFLIFQFFAEGGELSAGATRMPYLIFAVVFFVVAVFMSRVKLPLFKADETEMSGLGALKFPQLKLGIGGIFFYVGAEVTIGSFMISFITHDDIAGISHAVAKNYLSLYWGGAMIGRFLGSISLNNNISSSKKVIYMVATSLAIFALIFSIVDLSFGQISVFIGFIVLNLAAFFIGKSAPARTLSLFAAINIILLLVSIFTKGSISMWALISIGLFNSIMWSNIFTLSISGLGAYTSQGSSLLVMAILGGALVPLLQGSLADSIGIQYSFFLPAVCYGYILYFGYFCSKRVVVETGGPLRSGH